MQLRDKLLSAAPLSGDIESVVCAGKRGMINNDITDVVIAHSLFIYILFHVTTRYKCRFIIIIIFLSSFYFISIRKQIADSLTVTTLAILTCFQIPSL